MAPRPTVPIAENLKQVPPQTRTIVQAARRTVKAIAPQAAEIGYLGGPPSSRSAMWKIARYAMDGANVVGIGVFPNYATIFFYRGSELDGEGGELLGGGATMRFIRLPTASAAESPAVKRLVRQAFRLGATKPRP